MEPLNVAPTQKFEAQFRDFVEAEHPSEGLISQISEVILQPTNGDILKQCNKETLKAVREKFIKLKAPNADTVINRITVIASTWGSLPKELQKEVINKIKEDDNALGKLARMTQKNPQTHELAALIEEKGNSWAPDKATFMKNIEGVGAELTRLKLRPWITNEDGDITDDDFALIAKCCPNLEFLDISANTKITDKSLALIPKRVKELLCSETGIRGEGFINLPQGLLILNTNNNILVNFIRDLPPNLQFIRVNSFQGSSKDKAGQSYFGDLPKTLKSLDLGWTSISVEDYKYLPQGLEHFKAIHHAEINDDTIKLLPRTLKKLELGTCDDLTESCVDDFPPVLTEITLWYAFENLGPVGKKAAQAKLMEKFPNIKFEGGSTSE